MKTFRSEDIDKASAGLEVIRHHTVDEVEWSKALLSRAIARIYAMGAEDVAEMNRRLTDLNMYLLRVIG